MIDPVHPRAVVSALRQALPYLQLYRGKTFVVKIGGEIFDDELALRRLFEQVGVLHHLGVRCVVVHGGGPQTTKHAQDLGLEARLIAGRRVTDDATLGCALRVLCGELNTRAVALCRALGVPAVGLSGADGGLVVARRRPPRRVDGEFVDYGEVGDLVATDPTLLDVQLAANHVPIVAPISAEREGRLLNCNADGVAAALAKALRADKLLLVTGAAGILERADDPSSLVSFLDLAGLEAMVASGAIQGGMLPKAMAIDDALRGGVPRVHVISWRAPDGLLGEVFTNEGTGTLVVADDEETGDDRLAADEREAVAP